MVCSKVKAGRKAAAICAKLAVKGLLMWGKLFVLSLHQLNQILISKNLLAVKQIQYIHLGIYCIVYQTVARMYNVFYIYTVLDIYTLKSTINASHT